MPRLAVEKLDRPNILLSPVRRFYLAFALQALRHNGCRNTKCEQQQKHRHGKSEQKVAFFASLLDCSRLRH